MFRGYSLAVAVLPFIAAFGVALTACDNDEDRNAKSDGGSRAHDAEGPPRPTIVDAGGPTRRDAGGVFRDAGAKIPEAATDAGVIDASVVSVAPCTGDPPVMKWRDSNTNTELAPDFSCYDGSEAGAAPDAGSAPTRLATLHLAPFPPSSFGNPTVDVYFGPSTLGEPSYTGAFSGDASTFSFPIAAGIASVSIHLHEIVAADPRYSMAELFEYGLPVLTGEIEGFDTLKASRALSINLALGGGHEDPEKAVILSYARDCAGHPVSGAEFELIDGTTNLPVPTGTGASDPHSSYARFALPTTDCTFSTNEQFEASWMLVNAPVNVTKGAKTRAYRVRVKGRRRESDTVPVILREREVELFTGGTTFVRLDR